MRRAARVALLGLATLVLVGAPGTAQGWRGPAHPSARGVDASASSARQGGTMVVVARVRLPRRAWSTPDATAVVEFDTGPVVVELTAGRRGSAARAFPWWTPRHTWVGTARVPVPSAEPPGRVRVTVTVSVDGTSSTDVTWARVFRSRTGTPPPPPEDEETPPPCTEGCQEV